MIHWGFLILAFVVGMAACYGLLLLLAKSAGAFGDWVFGKEK